MDASLMAKRCTDSSEWERGEDESQIYNSTIFQYGVNEGYVKSDEGGSRERKEQRSIIEVRRAGRNKMVGNIIRWLE